MLEGSTWTAMDILVVFTIVLDFLVRAAVTDNWDTGTYTFEGRKFVFSYYHMVLRICYISVVTLCMQHKCTLYSPCNSVYFTWFVILSEPNPPTVKNHLHSSFEKSQINKYLGRLRGNYNYNYTCLRIKQVHTPYPLSPLPTGADVENMSNT